MAKKRRDKERDSSTVGKIAKFGVAALAVGGGAALFNNSPLRKKLSNELIPSTMKATKALRKELRDSKATRKGLDKRNTLSDYKKSFSKSKEVYAKEMADRAKGIKVKTDLSKKNNLAGWIKSIEQVKRGDLRLGLRDNYKSELQKNMIDAVTSVYSDKNANQVRDLALEAFKAIKSNTVEDKDNNAIAFSNFLSKKFKKAGFTTQEEQSFLTTIYNSTKDIDEKLSNIDFYIKDAYDKGKHALDATLLDAKKSSDNMYGKIDRLAKVHLGIDNLNSEMMFRGTRAMTVGDFKRLANADNFDFDALTFSVTNGSRNKFKELNVKDIISSLKDLDDSIIFDKNIRVAKDGSFYSVAESKQLSDKFFEEFSSSTLGRLFGLTDVKLDKKKPIIANFRALSTGKEAAYEVGYESGTLISRSKLAISNASTGVANLYETTLDKDGNLIMSDSIAEGVLRNNTHGKSARLNKEMLGTNKDILTANENNFLQALDLGQTGAPSMLAKTKSIFTKNNEDSYYANVLKRQKGFLTSELSTEDKIANLSSMYVKKQGLPETPENLFDASANIANLILEDNKKISSMLNNITALLQINDDSISSLLNSGNVKDTHSLEILNILNNKEYSTAEELLNLVAKSTDDIIYNKDLENIYKRGLANSDYISNMLNISQMNTKNILGQSIETTNVMDLEQVVKREAIKEVILRESNAGSKQGIIALENLIENSNLDVEQSKNLRYLANWSIMQSRMKLYNDIDAELTLDQIIGYGSALSDFDGLMSVSGSFRKGYTDMIDDLASRRSILDTAISNINQSYTNEYNNYSFMKRSSLSRLSQIESINDAIKILGEAGKELTAGRHDLNNYTTLTQLPQFMVARLGWGVEGFGLNLSHNSTGSTLDYIKNIGLKRIFPAIAAYNIYDYLDYESENFTGVSVTGAGANALANIDIASRKLAYGTGIGKVLDWAKESSVLGEYWTGSTDYQDAEERKEWYQNGYTAVRGGRFWGFGSASEYRGGNIQYYQQNYLRRAHSNYHEVSVYGSAEEKFKHSWLPSLRHPLSPLRAALDPYWLEKKNMEERPYPLTGKMFAEGTPWGAILNPTVGELLKPVRTLPEIRKRLGSDGRDIRQVVKNINDRIKAKADKNDDVLILEGTDIRNAKYVPYGNTGDGYANINISNGKISSQGLGFIEDEVTTLKGYRMPSGEIIQNYNGGESIDSDGEFVQAVSSVSRDTDWAVKEIIGGINNSIKHLAEKHTPYKSKNTAYDIGTVPDRENSTFVYTNLVNQMNNAYSRYYSQNYDPRMVNKNIVDNYLKDGTHSIRQLSGIYNFLGEMAFGETSYQFRYADAGAMTSFSRNFWDSQVGGLGGELMEIARRFFPSEDKSIIRYNPLRNSMPEWLPERFLTGDPFTSLPKGEMRMPGRGYETLNDLHSDQFGEYGAFDRYKILADIAPTSEEYKIWRNIARNTVTDPNLIKEMEDIEYRANKMSGKHEFYDYRYTSKNNVTMNKGVIKSINGSIIELVSGEQLNLGGINLLEEADVTQLLQVGQKIHYRTSADAIKRLEDGLITNAVIYKQEIGSSTNINKTLVQLGMAEKDKNDRSAIGYLANASAGQQAIGALQEIIGHANIPILHNKYMKIETARESFLNEQVYGNSFTTWDHPIKGFVKPAFNRVSSQSMLQHAGAIASSALFANIGKITNESHLKYGAGALMMATSPTALLGAGVAGVWNLGVRMTGINAKSNIELGAGIGSALGTMAWGWNNAENPLKATTSFALAGETLAKYLKADSNGKWGLIGAGIGLGISAIKNPNMSKDMFRSKWIPKATEKKYELDEYFDRLEYVKYQGLYNQAAMRAFIFEGQINVKSIFNKIDKNKDKIAKLTRKAEKLSNKYTAGGYKYEEKMAKINEKITALQSQRTMLKGGKYTKAAVAYKKAMESTIYGLNSGATHDEILAAVPDQYKDYYINFMNETSEAERKKILKMLPEYLRKPLQIAWRQKVDRVQSNKKFFKKHALPGMAWRGWKPNINLKHVKMKTIQNEGMLLSDFGYYESEKSKMEYHMARGIDNFDAGKGGISYLANMSSALSGLGVSLQNISVEQTSSPGLWIVGDIKQTVGDVMKVGEYGVASGLQGLTSLLF